ncbi:hypothetical protein ACLOJK_027806 [Asimina triloba]
MAAVAAAAAAVIANRYSLLTRPYCFLPTLLLRPSSPPLRFFSARSSLTQSHTPSSSSLLHDVFGDDEDDDDDEELDRHEDFTAASPEQPPTSAPITDSLRTAIPSPVSSSSLPLPNLSVKDKKELASFAHSLGKKLKCQQVGKSGVTPSVATAFVENLESNELLKSASILQSDVVVVSVNGHEIWLIQLEISAYVLCAGMEILGEMDDVVKQLEELTGSVAVGQIGRTVILYRPSLTKLKAAEKKKENAERMRKKAILRSRQPKVQVRKSPGEAQKVEAQKFPGRGYRGGRRFPSGGLTFGSQLCLLPDMKESILP